MSSVLEFTKSELVEELLILDGKKFSLNDYPFFREIYNGGHQNILLKTGRQVSKSTTIANLILVESSMIPYFKTMFIAPTESQSLYFSYARLNQSLMTSDSMRKHLLSGPKVKNSVSVKHFANGAHIVFRYATDNPDRARGFTADRLCYDEIQDMHESIFPVINECTTMSEYGYKIYAGTPKSVENIIEVYWQDSSQNEWVIKCSHCNHYNVPSVDNIGTGGLICKKCGQSINTRNGQWMSMSNNHKYFEGFHIPQIILPWYTEDPVEWDNILVKQKVMAPKTFMNEVMGVSDSQGTRIVTLDDLKNSCTKAVKMHYAEHLGTKINQNTLRSFLNGYVHRVAGIDWSGGGRGTKTDDGSYQQVSRTCISILGIRSDGVADLLAHKIFTPDQTQPEAVREIIKLCSAYSVQLIGADAGEGSLGNGFLKEHFGLHKVIPFRYSGTSGAHAKWNKESGCYVLNKTSILDNVLMLFRRRKIRFSSYEECRQIFDDILAEFEETTKGGEKRWTHSSRTPDDSLHSIAFAFCVYRAAMGNLDLQYAEEFLKNF